jgi:Flp pilus assembly protein TadB
MDNDSIILLMRWQALEKGDGLRKARFLVRVLWIAGLACCFVVVFGISSGLHPVAVAVAAAVMGWLVAESNALRTRLAQWPLFRRYIDWKHVEEDLAGGGR